MRLIVNFAKFFFVSGSFFCHYYYFSFVLVYCCRLYPIYCESGYSQTLANRKRERRTMQNYSLRILLGGGSVLCYNSRHSRQMYNVFFLYVVYVIFSHIILYGKEEGNGRPQLSRSFLYAAQIFPPPLPKKAKKEKKIFFIFYFILFYYFLCFMYVKISYKQIKTSYHLIFTHRYEPLFIT